MTCRIRGARASGVVGVCGTGVLARGSLDICDIDNNKSIIIIFLPSSNKCKFEID